ncbi:ComEA family DNA-binding protein [Janibacter anophelis]|uniref:ComEA family DNA-binding protein n=2 Tax=Janibacter anophelis TaxID=319054 RepID=UPI000A84A2E2|nr:ComEA family DNA-binding protein [Janibacter anophelis]
MSRPSEPSTRVAEILDESRDPRPLELPSTLATGRYGVSRQAIIGLALVVTLAVVMLGGRYVLARQDAAPQPVAMGEEPGAPTPGSTKGGSPLPGAAPEGAGAKGAGATGAGTPGARATAAARVTVHVVGEVESPGVVTLASGARVDDALEEAGGATDEAELSGVNLARPLVDGEQVVVPGPGETAAPAPGGAGPGGPAPAGVAPGGAAPGGAAPGAGTPGAPGTPDALVNLNTADLATLETLPGVGPVLAQRIIDWRTEHGGFTSVEELGEVSGVGDKTYATLAPEVTV